MTVRDDVAAIADGKIAQRPTTFTWAVHEGMRGATWLVLNADGSLLERRFKQGQPLGQPLPETKLGIVASNGVRNLAGVLIAQQFDRIRPPASAAPSSPTAAQVELSVQAGEERIDIRVPSHQLDQVPALKVIRDAFLALRRQAG
jgi:hypothetical protein